MDGEEIPRRLPERTGTHYCILCLAETPADEYFRNDHICDSCVSRDEEPPVASTSAESREHPHEPAAKAGGE